MCAARQHTDKPKQVSPGQYHPFIPREFHAGFLRAGTPSKIRNSCLYGGKAMLRAADILYGKIHGSFGELAHGQHRGMYLEHLPRGNCRADNTMPKLSEFSTWNICPSGGDWRTWNGTPNLWKPRESALPGRKKIGTPGTARLIGGNRGKMPRPGREIVCKEGFSEKKTPLPRKPPRGKTIKNPRLAGVFLNKSYFYFLAAFWTALRLAFSNALLKESCCDCTLLLVEDAVSVAEADFTHIRSAGVMT